MIEADNALKKEHGFMNRNELKYFAVFCMVCDHIGFAFFETGSKVEEIKSTAVNDIQSVISSVCPHCGYVYKNII